MKAMLGAALEGSLGRNKAVGTKLVCVSDKEAVQIGKNLVPSLMTEHLAVAGVNEWRVQNRAVTELMEEHIWFETMMVILGQGIVKTAAWGLMARVIIGAVMSVTDLATDIVILREFWNGGSSRLAFRNAQLASLVSSFVLQLMVTALVQHRKKGLKRILTECLIVLTGGKGPVDAYRIASGAEQEKDDAFSPMLDLVVTKSIELFAESIPGIIIQLSAIVSTINSGSAVTMTAYLSLLVSLLTTSFTSATISYDLDTDPKSRMGRPEFYGYVPDDGRKRAFLFIIMMLLSVAQVLIKAILIIVLASINSLFPIYYLMGDMAFYLVYKVARQDFTYWLPLEGVLSLAASGITRVVVKLVVDFAAIIHFRHSQEVSNTVGNLRYQ